MDFVEGKIEISDILRIIKTNESEYKPFDTTVLAQETNDTQLHFNYGVDGINGFTLKRCLAGHDAYDTVGNYYYKKNYLGDVIAIMDESGSELVHYVYDAWGNHKILALDGATYIEMSNINGESSEFARQNGAIGILNPYRYRSYYFDTETSLYYLNSRYYDSEVCRFINADDIGYAFAEKLNGVNLFAYCLNNPIGDLDRNGNIAVSTIAAIVMFAVGAAAGSVFGGVTAKSTNSNVGVGITVGFFSGGLLGLVAWGAGMFLGPAILGTAPIVGTSLSVAAHIGIGSSIAFGGGFLVGMFGDVALQVGNGRKIDWKSASLSGLQWGLTTVVGSVIGSLSVGLTMLASAAYSTVINTITGAFSVMIDVLRDLFKKRRFA